MNDFEVKFIQPSWVLIVLIGSILLHSLPLNMQLKLHCLPLTLWKHIFISFTLFFNYMSLFFSLLSMLFSGTAKHTSITLTNKLMLLRYFNYNKCHVASKGHKSNPTIVVRKEAWQHAICRLNLNCRRAVSEFLKCQEGWSGGKGLCRMESWRCCFRTIQKILVDPAFRWENPWLPSHV